MLINPLSNKARKAMGWNVREVIKMNERIPDEILIRYSKQGQIWVTPGVDIEILSERDS